MESQRPDPHKLQLLRQALSAAESSLSLARQLLRELEGQAPPPRPFTPPRGGPFPQAQPQPQPQSRELPGIVGTFDGTYMTTLDGRKFPVPEGYASKTKLIFGDRLKMIEEGGQRHFKQIEPVRRTFVNGILSQKEGRFVAVTADGSYRLLQSSLRYYGGGEGDEVRIILPEGNKHAPFAAIDSIVKKSQVKKEEPAPLSPAVAGTPPSPKGLDADQPRGVKSAGEPAEEKMEKPEKEVKPPEKEKPVKPKEKKEAPTKEVKKEAKTAKETPKKSSPKKSSEDEELR